MQKKNREEEKEKEENVFNKAWFQVGRTSDACVCL
jgi:hypothetical protein